MLEIRDLTIVRDGIPIVKNINLDVRRNEIHVLLGTNGSGKTTLAMGIMGIYPVEGSILLDGKDITHLSVWERARKGITLAFQEPARFEGLLVKDYLLLSSRERSMGEVENAIKMVGLPKNIIFKEIGENLSGGERKRIELAAVLLMRPKIAIFDEIDSGIDILSFRRITGIIEELRNSGTGILLITHSEGMIDVGDRASIMCKGTIMETGNQEKIKDLFKYSPCPLREA